ncbi:MAG: TIGR03620 family F420-dependent LLM class oxidoreductase [Acidimicrobiia bacterium]
MSVSSRDLAARLGPVGIWSSQFLSGSPTELADASRELERLGFGAIWLPESTWADPMVGAALILAATERLCVATGVVRIHARAAANTSNAWKGLSGWFPGRFVLGLGVSHRPSVERLGQSYDRPLATMVAYLDELAASRFDGRTADDEAPLHSVLAAVGPKMMALAAERTDGAHSYTSTAGHTATSRAVMGSEPLLAPEVKVVFDSDATTARAIARQSLPLRLPNYANGLIRSGFDPEEVAAVSDRVVDALVAWGDDDRIAAFMQSHLDAGADHVAVQLLTADANPAPVELWRRLARLIPGGN